MKIIIYLLIAIVFLYLGYKIAEITIANKDIKNNVIPIVSQLQLQLTNIQNKLKNSISEQEKIELTNQKNDIIKLLANFYGYSSTEIKNLIK